MKISDYLKPTVSGLWAHSHDAESDLMKPFQVWVRSGSGRLYVSSFDSENEANYAVSVLVRQGFRAGFKKEF